ncbi:MAG: aminotransferase class I/II-fold pyridoxal phosphate-dependent enzyme, partial [Ignavibacteria bacterium]|nr:aminotransferase class I/II-fold pyridoxal phosphate-dependent enzyme [Ignavibacteria bacterium]
MSLSLIAKSIKASPTLKLNEKFAILKEKGDPVIHLGGGEPKTKVPMDAILATVAHVNTGEVRYTPADGIPALKQAVIRYTEEFYERKVRPEHVIASGGAKQAIMVALQSVLNPQEEVLFP